MSYREDYILRQISLFIQALNEIMGLKGVRPPQEVLTAIDQTLLRYLGLNSLQANRLPETALIAMMGFGMDAEVGRARCLLLVELLKIEGDTYEDLDYHDESYTRYLKALNLFLAVVSNGIASADAQHYEPLIEEISVRLRPYELPTETTYGLFQYYEQIGKYAQAENALFELINHDRENRALINAGVAFYERLLVQDDHALRAGNLPRKEVVAGLAELQ